MKRLPKFNNIETITKEGLKLCRPTFIMIEGYPFYCLPETTNTMIKIYIRLYLWHESTYVGTFYKLGVRVYLILTYVNFLPDVL